MKRQILLALLLLLNNGLQAQSAKLKRADKAYETLSYAAAAEDYETLIGTQYDSPALKSRLADSYYQLGNMPKAEVYYAQVVSAPEVRSKDLYAYAQTLKQNGKYVEADRWMQQFHEREKSDLRGKEFTENVDYISGIEKQGIHFEIKNLVVNTATSDFGAYPLAQGNKAYFLSARTKRAFIRNTWSWNRQRFLDIYEAQMGGTQELENPVLFTRRINAKYHEGPLCFSTDGKTVYFTRNNIAPGRQKKDGKGIQNLKLYRAQVDASGKWTGQTELPFNSREYSVGHPVLSADGKTLYFASDRPGGFGGADLYSVEVKSDGTFGTWQNLGKDINTEGQDMFPWLSPEGLLFFSSDGHTGLGGLDVYVAFPDQTGGFGKLLNAGKPVNSQKDDFAFTMNRDGKTGYFSSNRDGGKGDDDIYSYTLIRNFKANLLVKGLVTDVRTKAILPGAIVKLKDNTGKVIATTEASQTGEFSFPVDSDLDYRIEAAHATYFGDQLAFTTKNLAQQEILQQDIDLEKDPGLALYALVKDRKTGQALEGVKMTISDNMTGEIFLNTVTPVSGDAKKGITDRNVGDRISYNIQLIKAGYLTKTVTFNKQITAPGTIDVAQSMDLSMDRIEIGVDLASIIEIKPIYFDLGKFVIRPDAAAELDKIVKVMNEYPTMRIELGSHTDCRASMAFNEKLSDNRAKASAAYIQAKISNPDRIYGKGYGESKLKVDCPCEGTVKSTCSEEQHQQNRRTEFIILGM